MNPRQLEKIGVPRHCIPAALQGIQKLSAEGLRGKDFKRQIATVVESPANHLDDAYFAELARLLVEDQQYVPKDPVSYRTWGADLIDDQSHGQMREACSLPNAVGAALMPDAHVGYGLPIGGVLALENAVCPYAVGVDIACRMKLSVLDIAPDHLVDKQMSHMFHKALGNGTVFGTGKTWQKRQEHEVMDQDWTVTRITRETKDKAWSQLGTSGSGNHFVEFGILTLPQADLGLEPGKYVALLSHSGSRGAGHAVCSTYSAIAQGNLPQRYKDFGRLAWLDLSTQAGQEYWAAMNLMGDYAAANHAVIHRNVARLSGAEVIAGVENHHNFAWKETHSGREVIVHRKGATPAGEGVLGVIPGSMASPGFVVRGLGNPESLHSASHGAGRVMSRKKARDSFRLNAVRGDLEKKGVSLISAGVDEVPMAYKDIHTVMERQQDLVSIVARFDPKIVKMCDDDSPAED